MNRIVLRTSAGIVAAVAVGFFGQPAPSVRAADTPLVVVAYGDTRTGVWGLGDNKKQRTHKVVVEALLKTVQPIDAVIFTGDAVMTTFPLWRQKYFSAFFAQTKQIVQSATSPKIPFYPSLGNHETYTDKPLLQVALEPPGAALVTPQSGAPGVPVESRVSSAYDRGEEAASAERRGPAAAMMDVKAEQGEKQLKEWEKEIEKGTPEQREEAAFGLGQFEGALQKDFHDQPSERRCQTDGGIFFTNYVNDAKYKYLDPLIESGARSYYSVDLTRGGAKIRLIALDTNCLDYPPQVAFFKEKVEQFDGVVIVFGHHPPIREDDHSVAVWDIVPGWEIYKPYFSAEYTKKIPLWVFGHVHNYQRANAPSASPDRVAAPVIVVAGGGGASDLNSTIGSNQWFPDGWGKPVARPVYNFVRIAIGETIEVTAYGTPKRETPFTQIDRFFIDR